MTTYWQLELIKNINEFITGNVNHISTNHLFNIKNDSDVKLFSDIFNSTININYI
jgi:hypothetical protein